MSAELVLKQINDAAATLRKEREELQTKYTVLETKSREGAARLHDLEQTVAALKSAPGDGRRHYPGGGRIALNQELIGGRLKAVHEGALSTGRMFFEGASVLHLKALVSGPSPVGYPTQADRGAPQAPVQRRLSLLELLQPQPVTSNAFEYVRLIRTQYADVQSGEGLLKRETTFTTELISSKIATVATHASFSRQVLGDTPTLTKVISDVLSGDVLDKLEQLLILGDSAGDQIEGMLTQAMPIAITASTPADAISEALATMVNSGYGNLLVLMNPLRWHALRTERAEGGDGQYLVGSWAAPAAPSIWGAPVVTSSSMPLHQALVIDAQKARLLDREQPSALISSEHADNFTRNLVTILAELRAGLAIFDSGAVGLVELPNNGSP